MVKDYKNEEVDDVIDESTDETIPYQYSITSYGADYTVDILVKRLSSDVIFVPRWGLFNRCVKIIQAAFLSLSIFSSTITPSTNLFPE
jgi:hypothetical protein